MAMEFFWSPSNTLPSSDGVGVSNGDQKFLVQLIFNNDGMSNVF
jgi:hypothetical protein